MSGIEVEVTVYPEDFLPSMDDASLRDIGLARLGFETADIPSDTEMDRLYLAFCSGDTAAILAGSHRLFEAVSGRSVPEPKFRLS